VKICWASKNFCWEIAFSIYLHGTTELKKYFLALHCTQWCWIHSSTSTQHIPQITELSNSVQTNAISSPSPALFHIPYTQMHPKFYVVTHPPHPLHYITQFFPETSAHLAYHVHKHGHKIPIINFPETNIFVLLIIFNPLSSMHSFHLILICHSFHNNDK